jgi:hypothetical protein
VSLKEKTLVPSPLSLAVASSFFLGVGFFCLVVAREWGGEVYKEQEVWAERDMACLSSSISSNLHSGFVCEARRSRREAAGSVQASETQFGEICSGSGSCLVSSAAAVAIRRRTSVRGRGGQSRVLTRKKNGIGSFANTGEEAAVAAAAALQLPAVFFVGESGAVLLRRRLGCCIVEDDDDDKKKNKRDRRKQTTVIMSSSIDSEPSKIVKGAGGAILEDVPHLTDWLPGLPVRLSHLLCL